MRWRLAVVKVSELLELLVKLLPPGPAGALAAALSFVARLDPWADGWERWAGVLAGVLFLREKRGEST